MDANAYRVRIYGCSSREPNKFREDLASVLGMSIHATGRLLEQTPVVAKSGLRKLDGEKLCARLESISAWSVLETETGDMVLMTRPEDLLPSTPALRFLGEAPPARFLTRRFVFGFPTPALRFLGEAPPDPRGSSFKPRSGILGRVVGALIVLVVGGLIVLVTRTGQPRSLPKPSPVHDSQSQVAWISKANQELVGDIEARIEDLRCTLSALYARRTEIQESGTPTDESSADQDIQTQITTTNQEIQALQSKLGRIESHKTP
jgi:hypothetical protein